MLGCLKLRAMAASRCSRTITPGFASPSRITFEGDAAAEVRVLRFVDGFPWRPGPPPAGRGISPGGRAGVPIRLRDFRSVEQIPLDRSAGIGIEGVGHGFMILPATDRV